MAFDRPALQTIINRIAADIESRLPGVDAKLRRRVLSVIGRATAGAAHGLHGHIDWLTNQILPDTAEVAVLERHASIWNISRKQAAQATGDIVFTGVDGTVIPGGTVVQRSDAVEFTTDVDGTIAAGTVTISVTAVDAGVDGNTAASSAVTLVNPISGCNSAAVIDAAGISGGADAETDAALRDRIVARIQAPAHGGRADDYELWALEVSGVTRVWVSPLHLGVGTVGIYVVCDDQQGSIIPDAAKVQEVQGYIDARRPVTAEVTVFAPVPVSLDMTITLLPDTAAIRTAVEVESKDMLRREAEPGGTILLSHLQEAISLAAGEVDHTLTAPGADVNHAAGELAVLGALTWA